MQYMGLNEIRESFLSYFESKGHLRLPSFPLVPINDKSLLLINSGMAPMKKFFTGEETPPKNRVCTCQKCIRTPDLERVGKTARHGTYFEMLGNFSFGDYFKNEAIPFAWEFLTKTLGIPEKLLWPSIYAEDEEAFHIWRNVIGVPEERIVRLGKEDNFWEHGTGPCGPCSEIYFDRGAKYGCGAPDCKPGCDCDRYMEIWNNVFSQFNSDGKGNYSELKQKNIDTGMGLERLACVMQGVDNMFEVDTIRRILDRVCAVSGVCYGKNEANDISIRIVTDHIRSASFMMCDGVSPSNEGRGYVLRRILRRAARHGKLLGIKGAFLFELCDTVIEENRSGYPEIHAKRDYIKKVISLEEERFDATIDSGLSILSDLLSKLKKEGKTVLAGEDVFKLYDTFGFPIDLTGEIAEEQGVRIDEEKFAALMQEQKNRARAARANISGWSDAAKSAITVLDKTEFLGYEKESAPGTILALFVDDERVESVSEGECTVVLDRTVFYGEGGGQVGDSGVLTAEQGACVVLDTKKTDGVFLHMARVENGILSEGARVVGVVDGERRNAIRRNHTAVHLLQAALRKVLGEHVEQAGSFVNEERFRFDFKHFEAMTPEEMQRTESIVNEQILRGLPVNTTVTTMAEAQKSGALALFGEKYGKEVRLIKMGDFSAELCGGTHLDNTAKAGLFCILSEQGIAAGVRRIEGTTGKALFKIMKDEEKTLFETAQILKSSPVKLLERAKQLQQEIRQDKEKIEHLNALLAKAALSSVLSGAQKKNGLDLIFCMLGEDVDMVALGDILKAEEPCAVAVLYSVRDGKIQFVAACGAEAVKAGAHAGNILKTISPFVGGGGGGKPDSARSGGKMPEKIDEAKQAFYQMF